MENCLNALLFDRLLCGSSSFLLREYMSISLSNGNLCERCATATMMMTTAAAATAPDSQTFNIKHRCSIRCCVVVVDVAHVVANRNRHIQSTRENHLYFIQKIAFYLPEYWCLLLLLPMPLFLLLLLFFCFLCVFSTRFILLYTLNFKSNVCVRSSSSSRSTLNHSIDLMKKKKQLISCCGKKAFGFR